MPGRHLPVRPNLDQLKHQAKDLLRAFRKADPQAVAEFGEFHANPPESPAAKLADAQFVLARAYDVASWPRLVQACHLVDAIWRDDVDALRAMILRHPNLLHEMARGTPTSNWGPPLSYAANLGRDRIIRMLTELGATDHMKALHRAALQGQIATARQLFAAMRQPKLPDDILGSPAYTLNSAGTALLFEFGAQVYDASGRQLAPVNVVLETDSRKPAEKHAILEMYVQQGLVLPDTPAMALHRGRLDLLELHLRRDPRLLERTFAFEEIYPPALGCHDSILATHGTPLEGATLLHMCADYDELEIAKWLLAKGMHVDAKAAVDSEGFGGHTALFSTVVSQPNFWMNHLNLPKAAPFTQLFLDHGADPNTRASLRKQIHPGYYQDTLREYRDVTPLSWGRRFTFKTLVSLPAMEMIAARGGHD